jgi:hypothetical protein
MQFAWLDLLGGRWLFLNGNLKYPARSWADVDAALSELEEEGWKVAGRVRKRRSRRTGQGGYAMVRTVH